MVVDKILLELPVHLYWKDKKGTFIDCNLPQAKSLRYDSLDSLVRKTAYDTLPFEQADKVFKTDCHIIQSDQGETKEEWITHHDGKKALMLSKKSPLKDGHGAIPGNLGISMDITEKKEIDKR